MRDDVVVDYWATVSRFEACREKRFAGVVGLRQLSNMVTLGSRQPDLFAARLDRVQIDHLALESFESTAHVCERGPAHIAQDPSPRVILAMVTRGRVRMVFDGVAADLGPGDVVLFDNTRPWSYEVTDSFRALRCVIGLEYISDSIRQRGTAFTGAIPRTALVEGFFAFVARVTKLAGNVAPLGAPLLLPAVTELATAVILETQQGVNRPDSASFRRAQIDLFIDSHLRERNLTPARIADAFGISVRAVHGLYSQDGSTIARTIRDRRLDAIATELRSSPIVPTARQLALHYGFLNVDTLMRAFKLRFGVSMRAYHRGERADPFPQYTDDVSG